MRISFLQLILISFSILLLNCKGKNEGVQIYNPSTEALIVHINDSIYSVEPSGLLDLDLAAGEIEIQSFKGDDQIIDTVVTIRSKAIKNGVMLNVSGENLYKLDEIYGAPSFKTIKNDIFYLDDTLLEKMTSQMVVDDYVDFQLNRYETPTGNSYSYNSVLVDHYIIVGKIDTYLAKQIVISLDWDYGPNTPYPNEIEVEDNVTNNAFGVYQSKLFSASELIDYYYMTYSYDMEGYGDY